MEACCMDFYILLCFLSNTLFFFCNFSKTKYLFLVLVLAPIECLGNILLKEISIEPSECSTILDV
uniref:Uncharacterized protein n=1 Tax=Helianthus annuus TaxID=4232 RepID=A0A251SGF9_HELAN